jgi:hypothetical protein
MPSQSTRETIPTKIYPTGELQLKMKRIIHAIHQSRKTPLAASNNLNSLMKKPSAKNKRHLKNKNEIGNGMKQSPVTDEAGSKQADDR